MTTSREPSVALPIDPSPAVRFNGPMNPQSLGSHTPLSPLWTRRIKFAISLFALIATAIYIAHLKAIGHLTTLADNLIIRAGAYTWQILPGSGIVFETLGVILMVPLFASDKLAARLTPRRPWPAFLLLTAALTFILHLIYVQLSGDQTFNSFFVSNEFVIAALISFCMILPHRKRYPGSAPPPLTLLGNALREPGRGWLVCFALLAGAGVALVSWLWLFRGMAIMEDGLSQWVQARLLVRGHFVLDASPALTSVVYFPQSSGTIPRFSQYPPGYTMELIPLVLLNLPPQVFDLLVSALTALLVADIVRRMGGGGAAIASGILFFASPFALILSGSAMNHASVAFWLTFAAWALLPLLDGYGTRPPAILVLAGLALGWSVATRPLTGLVHIAVWGISLLLVLRRFGSFAQWLKIVGWISLGGIFPIAMLLFYNSKTTGHPFVFGYMVSNPDLHRIGFHSDGKYKFYPIDAVNNFYANILALNYSLFGWAVGSAALLAVWWYRTRLTRCEIVLAALVLAQTFAYALYQFYDLVLGPRFLYEIFPLLVVFGTLALAPTLRRGGARAGALWLGIVFFSVGAFASGIDFWRGKFEQPISQHAAFNQAFQDLGIPSKPTVVLINPPGHESVGQVFLDPRYTHPLWFILKQNEAVARALPELQGYDWVDLSGLLTSAAAPSVLKQ